jgi:5-methylcytosine-specific restriction endonuclease McrA
MADSNVSTKRCGICLEIKPADCFHASKRGKDGMHSWCKPCKKSYYQARWAESTPEVKAVVREKALVRSQADPEAHRARSLAWKDANREQVNARTRELRKLHPEKERTRRQQAGLLGVMSRRQASKRFRERHPDRVKAARIRYQQANPEKYALWARNRRARIREVGGSHTLDDINRLFARQRGRCAACRKPLKLYHVDHIVALARGGSNDWTNLQLLCPPCNQQKHARDPIEFMQSRGFLI